MTKSGHSRKGRGRRTKSGKKHSPTELVEVLERVAMLDRRGYSGPKIAAEIGVSVTCVGKYLAKIRDNYAKSMVEYRSEKIGEMLAHLRDIRTEAWEAWERSKLDRKRVTKEKYPSKEPATKEEKKESGDAWKTIEKLKVIVTREGRLPANEYLDTILKTLDTERKLLGLDFNQDDNNVQGMIDWMTFLKPRAPDAIEARLIEEAKPDLSQVEAIPEAKVSENGHSNGNGKSH